MQIWDCILYRGLEHLPGGEILGRMEELRGFLHLPKEKQKEERANARRTFFGCVGDLLSMAAAYGFTGNLWQAYLTFLLVNHENAYSTALEIGGEAKNVLQMAALHDMLVFREFFAFDLAALGEVLETSQYRLLLGSEKEEWFGSRERSQLSSTGQNEFPREQSGKWECAEKKDLREHVPDGEPLEADLQIPGKSGCIRQQDAPDERRCLLNATIRERLALLSWELARATSAEAFLSYLSFFYRDFGVGRFGLNKAFRIEHLSGGSGGGGMTMPDGSIGGGHLTNAAIVPIPNVRRVQFDDLVGYETAKKKLIDNTEAFVSGRAANNCLLYGEAGTGKSSSIKALLDLFYARGLRIIEITRYDFRDLHGILEEIKNRNYRFILYMDDLSFEEDETEYKFLKAVIEGGLEKKPENVLLYATSNRRHLIRENYRDKEDRYQDMHSSDTVQEKLSLSARFGLQIYFGSPDKRQYEEIVRQLAARNGLQMPEEELLLQANAWELSHGGFSGRTAQQFIDDLAGKDAPLASP